MKASVTLAHAANPDIDYRGGYWGEAPKAKKVCVPVATFREASQVCRSYIEANELGGGNWIGGQIAIGAIVVARVSYNGRVWAGPTYPSDEITGNELDQLITERLPVRT